MSSSRPSNPPAAAARRALTATEIVTQLAQLEGWTLSGDGPDLAIEKSYAFADFHATMAFANAVAFVAHRLDHHPELRLSYRCCMVRWRTHDAGGITRADFDCAARVDALLE